jgi:hypothetical protein
VTTRETLLALAARVEKASGPDRELDGAINNALNRPPRYTHTADLRRATAAALRARANITGTSDKGGEG